MNTILPQEETPGNGTSTKNLGPHITQQASNSIASRAGHSWAEVIDLTENDRIEVIQLRRKLWLVRVRTVLRYLELPALVAELLGVTGPWKESITSIKNMVTGVLRYISNLESETERSRATVTFEQEEVKTLRGRLHEWEKLYYKLEQDSRKTIADLQKITAELQSSKKRDDDNVKQLEAQIRQLEAQLKDEEGSEPEPDEVSGRKRKRTCDK